MSSTLCVIKQKRFWKCLGLKKNKLECNETLVQYFDDSTWNVDLLKTEIKLCFQDVKEESGAVFCW